MEKAAKLAAEVGAQPSFGERRTKMAVLAQRAQALLHGERPIDRAQASGPDPRDEDRDVHRPCLRHAAQMQFVIHR